MANRYQVVIVGGGPVGVGLAVELGLRGINVALIERRVGLQNIPKGQNLTPRTLEHFYFWGIEPELRAARIMPKGYPISSITAYGNLMSEYWYAPPQREIIRPYYYTAPDRLPQYLTEQVLRTKMATLPNVESRMGWRADAIKQDENGVSVTVTEGEGGKSETLTADYVVGCDGSHSTVREAVGIARSGSDFDQAMVLAVFRSKELHEGLKRFPERGTFNVLHPDLHGYWQFFGRIDVGEGFFFHAPVPSDTTRDNYDFLGLLHRAAGFKFAAEFDHLGFWDLRVQVAERYRVGRVLIAGDAAHSHPPYGGFGLNNGLEDAANLGWKLAARIQGWGGDRLLDSYSEERRPVFQETGEDFIAARIRHDDEFMQRHNPERDKADFEKAWAARLGSAAEQQLSYEPNFEGSSVVDGVPGGKITAHGVHMWKARAGHHLAPQELSSGKNVFEALGNNFALLAFDAADADVRALEAAAMKARVPMKIVRDSYADGRTKFESKMILVRPDQYVVWTGDTAPKDPKALIAKVTGN